MCMQNGQKLEIWSNRIFIFIPELWQHLCSHTLLYGNHSIEMFAAHVLHDVLHTIFTTFTT